MRPLLLLLALLTLAPSCRSEKKIVLLVGAKSHPAGLHEYLKTARLLKVMLDQAPNLHGLFTEIHENGWPDDPSTLEDADVIITISDGQDGPSGAPVPFMTEERMAVMERQMERGCGFITYHFSTFAPDEYGDNMLEWGGGYFDWQNDSGHREWYSAITTLDTNVTLSAPDHPISRGVKPYKMPEEFYHNIRFRQNDPRLTPILNVPALESERVFGGVVAWAVERHEGGRGFGTTTGHWFAAWKNDDYRKLMLNAIIWAAGEDVPRGGVISRFYTDTEVTRQLFGKTVKGLLLTGRHHPDHPWQETTPVIQQAIEQDVSIHMDVSTNIEDLQQYDLRDYDFLVLNYCNWEDPHGLSDAAKTAFIEYLHSGGGLIVIHFANGAFHYSLPGAETSDWPTFRDIVRRVWDHSSDSAHDAYGAIQIDITNVAHEITAGLPSFDTIDELYFNQKGEVPIDPLLTARSTATGKNESLAWAYEYGKGRVFQTLLGHDAVSLSTPEVQIILRRAAAWTAKGHQLWHGL